MALVDTLSKLNTSCRSESNNNSFFVLDSNRVFRWELIQFLYFGAYPSFLSINNITINEKNNNLKLTHKLSSLLLENGYHLSNIFTSDWPNLLHSVAFYTNEIYPREDILYLSYLITMKFPSYDDE